MSTIPSRRTRSSLPLVAIGSGTGSSNCGGWGGGVGARRETPEQNLFAIGPQAGVAPRDSQDFGSRAERGAGGPQAMRIVTIRKRCPAVKADLQQVPGPLGLGAQVVLVVA